MVRLLILAILLATIVPVSGDMREVARVVSNIAVFVLFFLNGVRLSREQVYRGIANWRMLLPLIFWCFGMMAFAGWLLFDAAAAYLPPLIAMGLLFVGVLPSTVQSGTAYTSMAGGNVASSVVSAALLNIVGIFVSAPLFAWLSGGQAVQLGYDGLIKIVLILLLPFFLGQTLQRRFSPWLKGHPGLVSWMDRTAIAIAVYVAFSRAVEEDLWSRLDLLSWAALLAALTVFLTFAFVGSWLLACALRLEIGNRISFLFSGAHKSVAMGAPLALVIFPPDRAGVILVPLLLYHLLQLVISAPLAQRLSTRR